MQDFFRKHGVAVMTIRELFDFIVDPSITDESVDSYLEEVQQKILARGDVISQEDEIADSVFVQAFIPKTLDHVKNVEEYIDRITSGNYTGDIYYQTITGLKEALSMSHLSPAEKQRHGEEVNPKQDSASDPAENFNLHGSGTESGTDRDDDEDEENSSDDSEEHGSAPESGMQPPVDKRAARKENKKHVKEEKREARKTKVPKAVKKMKKKLAKAKKYR
ncbi:non-specific serine,threonine protein kinase [Sarracenia purpurea var. burkii]